MLKPDFSHGSVRRNAHHLPHSLQGVGWGGVGIVTFLRPRSCNLAQDVDAALTWSGVGMLTFLRPRSLNLAQDVDATLTRGGHMMGLHLDRHNHKFNYIDILSDDVDVVVDVVVVVDDDDPVELFQTRGKCWELIAMLPGPQAPQAPATSSNQPGSLFNESLAPGLCALLPRLCADSSWASAPAAGDAAIFEAGGTAGHRIDALGPHIHIYIYTLDYM